MLAKIDTDTTEGKICRVCLETDANEALESFCACRGSVKYLHQSCYITQLQNDERGQNSRVKREENENIAILSRKCELCKEMVRMAEVSKECCTHVEKVNYILTVGSISLFMVVLFLEFVFGFSLFFYPFVLLLKQTLPSSLRKKSIRRRYKQLSKSSTLKLNACSLCGRVQRRLIRVNCCGELQYLDEKCFYFLLTKT